MLRSTFAKDGLDINLLSNVKLKFYTKSGLFPIAVKASILDYRPFVGIVPTALRNLILRLTRFISAGRNLFVNVHMVHLIIPPHGSICRVVYET